MSRPLKRIIIAGITLAVLAVLSWGAYRIYSYYCKGRIVKVVKLTEFQTEYSVTQAAFSPDGQKVAVVIKQKDEPNPRTVLEIRDVQTGKIDKSLPLPKSSYIDHYRKNIQFSSSNLILLVFNTDIIVWDAATGNICFHIEREYLNSKRDNLAQIEGATFSSDGTELAIWGRNPDYNGIFRILDAKTGQKKEEIPAKWLKKIDFKGYSSDHIVFSPDSSSILVVTFFDQLSAWIWDRELAQFTAIPLTLSDFDHMSQVAFSADAKKIFGVTHDGDMVSYTSVIKPAELPDQSSSIAWRLRFHSFPVYWHLNFLWKYYGLYPILIPPAIDFETKWFGDAKNFIEVVDTLGRTYPLSLSGYGAGGNKEGHNDHLLDTTISQDGRYFTAILSSGRIITWDLGAFAEKVKVKSRDI